LALDEPKDGDDSFEFGGLKFVVEKQLLENTGGICVDFVQKGYFGGYQIEPKIPLKRSGSGSNECGSCSC
jgi:Fe-S cluster assembly iron-binding protein IscA